MQTQINIQFKDLVQMAKQLPLSKWNKLKYEVEKEITPDNNELELFLLNAPTFTNEQIKKIDNNRNNISKWRTT